MADPKVATKAPESDAQETTTVSTETPQTTSTGEQPKVCDDCVTDRPTPSGQGPTGEVTKLGGVDVYISKPSDYPQAPARLLLLLTGGTGFRSVNNQIQADKFASEGFVVVMPDMFDNDPAPNTTAALEEAVADGAQQQQQQQPQQHSLLDTFKMKAAETAKSFLIDMWLARHTEEKVLPVLRRVLAASRDEFADAVSNGGGVYAVGYCFGGRYVLLLATERPDPDSQKQQQQKPQGLAGIPFLSKPPTQADEEANRPKEETAEKKKMEEPAIKAGALAHATLVSKHDFVGLRAPVSVVCVENDPMFPDEVRTAGEDYMAKNNVEHEVQVYPGVPHGFAVVGEYEEENIKTAQAMAYEQMLKWLKDH